MNTALERKNYLLPASKFDDQKFEFLFVLDRSGSMSGQNIVLARRALGLFLRSLPVTCRFNVISFGTRFESLYPESVEYSESSLKSAYDYANKMNANFGGTELLPPLQHIYNLRQFPEYLTQIFILTDGAVSNENGCINLIAANKPHCRVFALGIGSGASRSLVDRAANTGGGTSCFVAEHEKIESKILNQLKIALQPSLLKPVPVN